MASKKLEKAIDALASRFVMGELMAATDSVGFIEMVTEEVDGLRTRVALLEEQVELLEEEVG
jgi:hypothetical protein